MKQIRLTLANESGLHARPAAMFVQEASRQKCRITVEANGRKADARSILQVLTLGARCGDSVIVTADGEGEEEAVGRLADLINTGLKE